MSEKINMREEIRNWSLLAILFLNGDEVTQKISTEKEYNSTDVEIEMKINGVDFPVKETWAKIELRLNEWIERKAIKLLEERLEDAAYDNEIEAQFLEVITNIKSAQQDYIEKIKKAFKESIDDSTASLDED